MENVWNNLYQNVKKHLHETKNRYFSFLDLITTVQEVMLDLQRYIIITKLKVLRTTMLQPCYRRKLEVNRLQMLLVFSQVAICSPDSCICRRPAHSLSYAGAFQ